MSDRKGVWIDHRRALVVTILPQGEQTAVVVSNVEKHPQRSGDSALHGSYEAAQVPADDRRQRALTGDLAVYYDAVITALGHFDGLYIFGPGEAKGQLKTQLAKRQPGGKLVVVETADSMSDRQVVARVRAHFSNP